MKIQIIFNCKQHIRFHFSHVKKYPEVGDSWIADTGSAAQGVRD